VRDQRARDQRVAINALAINALAINALAINASRSTRRDQRVAIAAGMPFGHTSSAESRASLPRPHRQACAARLRGPAAGASARGHLVGSGPAPTERIKP
jgi:hypothetical protein